MKADLHLHTTFSDGISSPEEVVKSAIEKGIECICVTDHQEVGGAVLAMKFGYDKNILVIPGIEVLSKSGDILGINIKKVIPDGLSAEETIAQIRQQGGLAAVPHPFNWPVGGFLGGWKALEKLAVDAFEVFNSTMIFTSLNIRALNFVRRRNLSFTAGSDAHRAEFIGRGYLEIDGKISSARDVIGAIIEKRAKVGGKPLSIFEKLKNGAHVNIRDVIDYYHLKPHNERKSFANRAQVSYNRNKNGN